MKGVSKCVTLGHIHKSLMATECKTPVGLVGSGKSARLRTHCEISEAGLSSHQDWCIAVSGFDADRGVTRLVPPLCSLFEGAAGSPMLVR